MKTLVLQDINKIEASVLEDTTLEKLVIKGSEFSIPKAINKLTGLKELQLLNNRITALPLELLDLEQTFVFFENNEPKELQAAGLLLFDLQWKKITIKEAKGYLQLLQKEVLDFKEDSLMFLIQALSYRVQAVRETALEVLDTILTMKKPIPENAVIAILGKPSQFALSDITHRLKNVGVSYQTKITTKTTHIVLCMETEINEKTIDSSNIILATETHFMTWLNQADEQMLSKKTEENIGALENVSQMLLGGQEEQVELALQMMKIHGVSKELLTDLFVFFNESGNKNLKRKTKSLFKKHAPKELLEHLETKKERYLGTLEVYSSRIDFYHFLLENPYMDAKRIAFFRDKGIYIDLAADSVERKQFLSNIIRNSNGVLDIAGFKSNSIPEEVQEITGVKAILCEGSRYKGLMELSSLPDWIGTLELEKLDLYNQNVEFPATMANLKKLTYLCLPTASEAFPMVITQIKALEVLEMHKKQFLAIPEAIQALTNLKQVVVYSEWEGKLEKKVIEEKKLFLPKGCVIVERNSRD